MHTLFCRRNLITAVCLAALAPPFASAQTSATASAADAKPLGFEVVSVRQNRSGNRLIMPGYGPTADGYHAKGIPATLALLTAYAPTQSGDSTFFNQKQVEGAPGWFESERYDFDAKVADGDLARWQDPVQQPAMLRAMLQAVLADRFKLAVHREKKEQPVFELTVAKGEPKFKPSAAISLEEIKQKHAMANRIPGGAIVSPGSKPGELIFYDTTMAALGTILAGMVGRTVEDKTGLAGRYDFSLQINPEGGGAPNTQDAGLPVVTALEEQLGLKLRPAKGAIETLVIDHVERPTEN